jgi:hypothetical protein
MPAVLVLASLACTFGQRFDLEDNIDTATAKVMILNEAMPDTKDVQDLTLTLAVGELNLTGGAQSLLEGKVYYSSDDWKPFVHSEGNSLTVSQGDPEYVSHGLSTKDAVNRWEIQLGNIPMNLSLQAGAYDVKIDLSGVPIQRLDIQDGVSEAEIRFDSLNPETMTSLTYTTGASDVTLLGLANANFTEMTFEGKLGTYNFDFTGSLQQDATVNLKVPFSTVRILVPEGMFTEFFVEDGSSSITAEGAWSNKEDHYINIGSGSKLTIIVEASMGNLHLVNE